MRTKYITKYYCNYMLFAILFSTIQNSKYFSVMPFSFEFIFARSNLESSANDIRYHKKKHLIYIFSSLCFNLYCNSTKLFASFAWKLSRISLTDLIRLSIHNYRDSPFRSSVSKLRPLYQNHSTKRVTRKRVTLATIDGFVATIPRDVKLKT